MNGRVFRRFLSDLFLLLQIIDAVLAAYILNATLVVPKLDQKSYWKDTRSLPCPSLFCSLFEFVGNCNTGFVFILWCAATLRIYLMLIGSFRISPKTSRSSRSFLKKSSQEYPAAYSQCVSQGNAHLLATCSVFCPFLIRNMSVIYPPPKYVYHDVYSYNK